MEIEEIEEIEEINPIPIYEKIVREIWELPKGIKISIQWYDQATIIINKMLDELKLKEQNALLCKYYLDMNLKETAYSMYCCPATAKKLLTSAFRKINHYSRRSYVYENSIRYITYKDDLWKVDEFLDHMENQKQRRVAEIATTPRMTVEKARALGRI